MESNSQDNATPSIATLKLPEFWPADSELWFLHIEAQFRRHRIASQTAKYDYVVSALSPTTTALIRDVLLTPPPDNPYDILKRELLRRTTDSESRRIQQLLSSEELGDRKPTELLRRMTLLLGGNSSSTDSKIVRELFLQRLPNQVRMILCASPAATSIEDLATTADQIMDTSHPFVSAIDRCQAPVSSPLQLEQRFDELSASNAQLASQVHQLTTELATLRFSAGRDQSRHRTPNQSNSRYSTAAICWYHARYGTRARQCRPPCNFSGNGRASH